MLKNKRTPKIAMYLSVAAAALTYFWYLSTSQPPVLDLPHQTPATASSAQYTYEVEDDLPPPTKPKLVVLDASAYAQGFSPAEVCPDLARQLEKQTISKMSVKKLTRDGVETRFLIPAYNEHIDVAYCPGLVHDSVTKTLLQNGSPVAFME